jgi:D-alanyl-D-alanine carboxypeptidase (penicillin-binding protein 5/6)
MGIRESSEEAAKKMLTWGFANADRVEPVGMLVEKGSPIPVDSDADFQQRNNDLSTSTVPTSTSFGEGAIDGPSAAAPLGSTGGLPLAVVAIAVGVAVVTLATVLLRRRGSGNPRA